MPRRSRCGLGLAVQPSVKGASIAQFRFKPHAMSRAATSLRAGVITATVTAVAASLLVVNQAATPAPAALPSSAHLATVPDTFREETLECDCAPLWQCIERGEGGCGILDAKLRECMARSRTT